MGLLKKENWKKEKSWEILWQFYTWQSANDLGLVKQTGVWRAAWNRLKYNGTRNTGLNASSSAKHTDLDLLAIVYYRYSLVMDVLM